MMKFGADVSTKGIGSLLASSVLRRFEKYGLAGIVVCQCHTYCVDDTSASADPTAVAAATRRRSERTSSLQTG